MGLTSALFTGLSGMTTNSEGISNTGNNISNANTTGFKSNRLNFESAIVRTVSGASAPTANLGGTNAAQIGYGAKLGSIDKLFKGGSLQPTGVNTDMAVDGNGFFVLNTEGRQVYSRVGSFALDRDFNLVNPSFGGKVQGYGVDEDFEIVDGELSDINIPIGALTIAEATENIALSGVLNAGGDVATQGSLLNTNALTDGSGGPVATGATLLANIFDTGAPPVSLFSVGDVITVQDVTKASGTIPTKTFEVGAANTTGSDDFGATVNDFMDFLNEILGIDETADPSAGITINAAGEIVIQGNTGTQNDITIENGNIIVNAGSVSPSVPFEISKTQEADGESLRTTFVVFDSLGTPLTIDFRATLEEKTNSGTTWRFYIQSEDDTDLDRVLSTGTIEFDTNGKYLQATNAAFVIDRNNTGAETPLQVTLGFNDGDNTLQSLVDRSSIVNARTVDGSAVGTLEDFTVELDGRIVGTFSNSLTRTLGRVTLAMFSNNNGLLDLGNGLYDVSVNSGNAIIVNPGQGGSGSVVGQALEMSNVELSNEFINLITQSTGFSASSRVLTTSDELIQELLSTVR